MNFKILFVLLLMLHSVQANAGFTATECHDCQGVQYAQRAVSRGEGYHFIMNFGDHPGIRHFHVQNVLLGTDPVERRLAERGYTYVLGAIPQPVPAEAEAQFKMIKEAIDLAKGVTSMEIPAGTDLDPAFHMGRGVRGYRLENIMQLAPRDFRTLFLARVSTHLNGLRSLSPHGIAFMRARGYFGADFSVGEFKSGINIYLEATHKPSPEFTVTVNDQYGGRVVVWYNPGAPNGMILEVRGGDGERLDLDIIYGMVSNKVNFDIPVGFNAGAAKAYSETLRKTFQLPDEFVPRHDEGSGRLVCGDVERDGQARYTCYPGD
ncbi:MAG: hypothetical protein MUE46_10730 [Xanthomonadales bacterium]|jgi:hypothetical protein|nr:hypothetical protein [Xanthomonadales bacterium]